MARGTVGRDENDARPMGLAARFRFGETSPIGSGCHGGRSPVPGGLMKPTLFAVAALVIATVAWPVAASAYGPTPITACGTTVAATNVYLPHNLRCASGGIVLASPNTTLDLRGHRLVGPGPSSSATGVTVRDNYTRVTNGTIVDWGTSMSVVGDGIGVQLTDLTFVSAVYGVLFSTGAGVTVDRGQFRHVTNGFGGVSGSPTLKNSTLVGDGSGTAFNFGADGSAVIDHTVIKNYGTGVSCDDDGCTISNSQLTGNDTAAAIGARGGMSISNSTIAHNRVGLDVTPDETSASVDSSRLVDNDVAVQVKASDDSGGLRVTDSTFQRNRIGVSVAYFGSPVSPPLTITITGNTLRSNGAGVSLLDPYVTSQIGTNTAIANTSWGIYAIGNVTDLGGNVARGNGEAAQCFGVVCARH